ncbi:MAG: RecQ family ATP-dependent DNA helicase [Luteibaculum sp.]
MLEGARDILKKHWGFPDFRPNQVPLVQSVIENHNTLGLLPTGGGKSICYQVPGLLFNGISIVISPLISLIEDQHLALKKRGISSVALTGKIQLKDLDRILDNCVYGNIKFLFLAPERLQNDLVRARISKMPVALWVIDEAHCVSQWGHDFRPSYLQIKEAIELKPAKVLALTATATPAVVKDIEQYCFPVKPKVLRGNFLRENLGFFVRYSEKKDADIMAVCKKQNASGIIYTRSRKNTKYYRNLLRENDINALAYHAGMTQSERAMHQEKWGKSDDCVMVATSAFGMGIDKPNVRYVVHPELPESLEAFIQEAGRAGRNGKKAYSLLLYNREDLQLLEDKLIHQQPEKKEIIRFYSALFNAFKIAQGTGINSEHHLLISPFSKSFQISPSRIPKLLDALQYEGILEWSAQNNLIPKVQIVVDASQFYKAQLKAEGLDKTMEALGRMYQGIFEYPCTINYGHLQKFTGLPEESIKNHLQSLSARKLIHYEEPQSGIPIRFLKNRFLNPSQELRLEKLNFLKERAKQSFQNIKNYITLVGSACRQQMLCEYFGEEAAKCGVCDLCLANIQEKPLADLILENLNRDREIPLSTLLKKHLAFKLDSEAFYQALRDLKQRDKITWSESDQIILK